MSRTLSQLAEVNRSLSFGVRSSRLGGALAEGIRAGAVGALAIFGTLLTAQVWMSAARLGAGESLWAVDTHFRWLAWLFEGSEVATVDAVVVQIELAVLGLTALYAALVLVPLLRGRNLVLSASVIFACVLSWTVLVTPFAPLVGWLGTYGVLLLATLFCRLWRGSVGRWSFRGPIGLLA